MAARTTQETLQTVIDLASGDPHRAGILPLSFVRQVLAACLYPDLLQDDNIPLDARQRAQQFLDICPGGSVVGMPYVLQKIAEFISRRDGGVTVDPNKIIFNSGTQENVKMVLDLLSSGRDDLQTGVLTPLPYPHTLPRLLQYYGLSLVPYRLEQSQGWAVDMEELHRAVTEARTHCNPRALFICNPGIPTGHVQNRKSIESVIRFAATEQLFLLVQEVYQDCMCEPGIEFLSYKKVLLEMSREYSEHVEIISFNSLSNTSLGECGLRGGYMELINTDNVVAERLKVLMGFRSPPVLPQSAMEVMMNPPTPGEPSYQLYSEELSLIQSTLSRNAQRGCEVLNSLKGVSCQPAMGGIFLYPRLDLPGRYLEEAKTLGLLPDVLYCQMLLDKAGVRLGAGSENGSEEESGFYIRLSFAASSDIFHDALSHLCSFHLHLFETYS
ncbi:hypothetical protein WMY93_025436 [Mugilogobius chulae]|uniref:alanine transaminase n=1 Tax=Mugilogobius chulae TaxID=88201 RepID=A0AAW0N9B1_9GOBI